MNPPSLAKGELWRVVTLRSFSAGGWLLSVALAQEGGTLRSFSEGGCRREPLLTTPPAADTKKYQAALPRLENLSHTRQPTFQNALNRDTGPPTMLLALDIEVT